MSSNDNIPITADDLFSVRMKLKLIRTIARDQVHGTEASFADIILTAQEALDRLPTSGVTERD